MGAGYAYWSETVVIKTTVTTGELSVEFLPYDQRVDVDEPVVIYNNRLQILRNCRVTPFTLQDDNHTLVARFIDVFPGVYYSVPFIMHNNGTIPADFKRCTITADIKDSCLKPGDNEADLLAQLYANLKINSLYFEIYDGNRQIGNTIYCVNDTPISLGELENMINTTLRNAKVRLEPGHYLQVSSEPGMTIGKEMGGKVQFLFSSDFDNSFESREFTVNINMEWKQFNDPSY